MFCKKKTIMDILRVSVSNIIKLLSGILVGFLLPRIIGVTDYGYYKTFTLYSTYVGLFHLGICDGIYLKYGGKNYEELDKKKFRKYSCFFVIVEGIIALIIMICGAVFLAGEYRFIFICLSAYLFFTNITGYYQIISQITSRFRELSHRNVIQSLLMAVSVVGIWAINKYFEIKISYRIYTLIYIFITAVLAVWYMGTYRDISFGNRDKTYKVSGDIYCFIRTGFPLTVANLCSSLILTLDRQFVNVLFDTDTYAVYAFAYNMLSLVTTAIAAVSTVIYPELKQKDEKKLFELYPFLLMVVLCLVFACLTIYFPLCAFVEWFLPKYTGSIRIFRVIFPGLAISSAVTIIIHNYYKAIGRSFSFFIKSIVVLITSTIANAIAYVFWGTTISVSVASIICMIFWYLFTERLIIREFKVLWKKNCLYLIVMIFAFYTVSLVNNYLLGCLLYIAFFGIITFGFYRRQIGNVRR
ncbi:MAG: oligosaccharide flippase family protein [Lachnospiraceae bacterium]|nr:oligosaccharide flippase family protein [Lachnospiraceae bacterium]